MITFVVSAVIRLHKTQMQSTSPHIGPHKTHTGQRAYLMALCTLSRYGLQLGNFFINFIL